MQQIDRLKEQIIHQIRAFDDEAFLDFIWKLIVHHSAAEELHETA